MRFDIPWFFLIPYLFVLGATIGSFLNVCVYRLPKHERLLDQIRGLWSPPSHCPRCKRRILLRDNLPVVGWLRRRIFTRRTSPWICMFGRRWPNSRRSRSSLSRCTDSRRMRDPAGENFY